MQTWDAQRWAWRAEDAMIYVPKRRMRRDAARNRARRRTAVRNVHRVRTYQTYGDYFCNCRNCRNPWQKRDYNRHVRRDNKLRCRQGYQDMLDGFWLDWLEARQESEDLWDMWQDELDAVLYSTVVDPEDQDWLDPDVYASLVPADVRRCSCIPCMRIKAGIL